MTKAVFLQGKQSAIAHQSLYAQGLSAQVFDGHTSFESDQSAIRAWLLDTCGSKHTVRAYSSAVDLLLQRLSGRPLARLTRGLLGELGLRPPAIPPARVAALKSLYGFLLNHGYVQSNPFATIKLRGTLTRTSSKLVQQSDWADFFAWLGSTDHSQAERGQVFTVALLFLTSLRASELGSIRLSSISLISSGHVPIYGLTVLGKGHKLATIPLIDGASRVIEGFYNESLLELIRRDDYLVPRRREIAEGKKADDYQRINSNVKALVKRFAATDPSRAWAAKLSAHWFRHARTQSLLRGGAQLPAVQQLDRHADPKTTMGYGISDATALHAALEGKADLTLPILFRNY